MRPRSYSEPPARIAKRALPSLLDSDMSAFYQCSPVAHTNTKRTMNSFVLLTRVANYDRNNI